MKYTEVVEREIQIMESCVKSNGLTEHGKSRLKELKECRDAFKNLHLQNVTINEVELKAFLHWLNNLSVEETVWYEGRYIATFKSL